MWNMNAILLTVLISCGVLTSHQSLAKGVSTSVIRLNTPSKRVVAVASIASDPKPAATTKSLNPNWLWTTTVNVYGYTQVNGSFGATITASVDRVVIESDTKGFSWSATWNRSDLSLGRRVKWYVPNVPVDKSYKITAYARGGKQISTSVKVLKPKLVASDLLVPDFVFNY